MLADKENALLPLFCVIALDFLVCLLTRVVVDETEPEEDDEDGEDGEEESSSANKTTPTAPPPPPIPSNKSPPPPPRDGGGEESRQPCIVSHKEEVFYAAHGESLMRVLLKTTSKLLVYCRLYAMIGNQGGGFSSFTDLSRAALDGIMKLAGRDQLQPKDTKPLFHVHIPEEVRDRIKAWNGALLIDPAHKEKLCSHDLDSPVGELIVQFLNLHFYSFTDSRSFGLTRCLKSTLSSLVSLLSTLFEMCPADTFADSTDDQTSPPLSAEGAALMSGLVPLSCDVMMDFCGADMLKLVKICGERAFSLAVLEHRVRQSSKLLQLPRMTECHLLGPLLADFFGLLSSLLEDSASKPVLSILTPDNPDCRECAHIQYVQWCAYSSAFELCMHHCCV